MQHSGTRHRRTQTASISQQGQRPVEIVITASSPQSESFPIIQLPPTTRSNLFPPLSSHDSSSQAEPLRAGSITQGERWSRMLVILLALIIMTELLRFGKVNLDQRTREEKIIRGEDEQRRNLMRREIASKLFPNVTFYPASRVGSTSQSASRSPTTYLFPVKVAEQESKAQQHLHQLALLAISLNRTLVLPNVGGSRLHSCHLFPSEVHYDVVRWRERYEGKLSVVGQEAWLQELHEAKKVYTTRSVRLSEGKKVSIELPLEEERLDLEEFCLGKVTDFFDPARPSMSTFYAPFRYREFDNAALGAFANGIVASLSRSSSRFLADHHVSSTSQFIPLLESAIPSDILLVDYNLRYPIFPTFVPSSTDLTPTTPPGDAPKPDYDSPYIGLKQQAEISTQADKPAIALYDPFPFLRLIAPSSLETLSEHPFLPFRPMPYSTMWIDLATSIAQRLSPYAAVHWRMETVPRSHLSPCATTLARTLRSLASEPLPPTNIYLASDYSFDSVLGASNRSATAHSLSDTFTDLTSSHRAAAMRLVSLLRPSTSLLSWVFPSWFYRDASPPPRLQSLATVFSSTSNILPSYVSKALEPLGGDLFALDTGLKGIVDKLVLAQADHFFAGSAERGNGMCAKGSSFTENVLDQRREVKGRFVKPSDSGNRVKAETPNLMGGERSETDEDIVRWFSVSRS